MNSLRHCKSLQSAPVNMNMYAVLLQVWGRAMAWQQQRQRLHSPASALCLCSARELGRLEVCTDASRSKSVLSAHQGKSADVSRTMACQAGWLIHCLLCQSTRCLLSCPERFMQYGALGRWHMHALDGATLPSLPSPRTVRMFMWQADLYGTACIICECMRISLNLRRTLISLAGAV
jgi:hypothetical protein